MTLGESRERSRQQENESRGRETIEAGDSALEEDVSEEEVGLPKSYHSICVRQNICSTYWWQKLLLIKFFTETFKRKHHEYVTFERCKDQYRSVSGSGRIRIIFPD